MLVGLHRLNIRMAHRVGDRKDVPGGLHHPPSENGHCRPFLRSGAGVRAERNFHRHSCYKRILLFIQALKLDWIPVPKNLTKT